MTVPGHLSSRKWQGKVKKPLSLSKMAGKSDCNRQPPLSETSGKIDVTRLRYFTVFCQRKMNVFRPRLIIVNPTLERCFLSSCLSILSNRNERFYSWLSCICVLQGNTESFRANSPLYILALEREGKFMFKIFACIFNPKYVKK